MKPVKFSILLLILLLVACSTPQEPTPEPATTEPAATNTAVSESVPQEEPSTTKPAAVAIPTEESATETAVPQSNLNEFTYNGVSFQYDSSLASDIKATTIPASEQRFLGPGWSNSPSHDQFAFSKYTLLGTFPASIYVYPVLEATSRNHRAKTQVEALQTILTVRPEREDLPTEMPYLPLRAGSQPFNFNPQFEYVPFANGEGIRYLTMFGFSVDPIINRGLHYTFQGLTDDGQYYVSATFPVHTDALPNEEPADLNYDEFSANYEPYIQEIVETLNDHPDNNFTPNLTLLDDVAQSITVEREPEPRRTDENGNELLTIEFPVHDGQVIIGQEITITGYAPRNSSAPISVTLNASGNTLIETIATLDQTTGNWQSTFMVPATVIGRGQIKATMDNQTDEIFVYLDDIYGVQTQSDITIGMNQPIDNETAVSGYPVFFEGIVENPIGDTRAVQFSKVLQLNSPMVA